MKNQTISADTIKTAIMALQCQLNGVNQELDAIVKDKNEAFDDKFRDKCRGRIRTQIKLEQAIAELQAQ
jgi:hypothetical protein